MILKQQRGERGATVKMKKGTDGRLFVEVVGADGVTEEYYENLDRKNADRLYQDALDRDTDEWLVETLTECISCSAPAPLVAPETGDRWCQKCWDAAGAQKGEA